MNEGILESIEKRLIRIESRLVQLMLHMGLDPYAQADEAEQPTYHKRGS